MAAPLSNMAGRTYGALTVLRFVGRDKEYRDLWECRCTCGKTVAVTGKSLRNGTKKSCGCMQYRWASMKNTKHGMSNSRLYNIWTGMKSRCFNSKDRKFKNYGMRGITVCPEWRDNFAAFASWAVGNGYEPSLTIERIDVNGNYCPENCTWIPAEKQGANKTNNHRIRFNGKTQTLADWSKELNINYGTLKSRITRYGWAPERALSEKIHNNHGRN